MYWMCFYGWPSFLLFPQRWTVILQRLEGVPAVTLLSCLLTFGCDLQHSRSLSLPVWHGNATRIFCSPGANVGSVPVIFSRLTASGFKGYEESPRSECDAFMVGMWTYGSHAHRTLPLLNWTCSGFRPPTFWHGRATLVLARRSVWPMTSAFSRMWATRSLIFAFSQ